MLRCFRGSHICFIQSIRTYSRQTFYRWEGMAATTNCSPPELLRTQSPPWRTEPEARGNGKSKRSRYPSKDRRRPNCKSSSHKSQSSSSDLSYFDPGSLVKNKEGTFKPSKSMVRYLQRHFRRCLSKEEWDTLIKEHPLPDTDACTVPKADRFLSDYLGRCFPKSQEANSVRSSLRS